MKSRDPWVTYKLASCNINGFRTNSLELRLEEKHYPHLCWSGQDHWDITCLDSQEDRNGNRKTNQASSVSQQGRSRKKFSCARKNIQLQVALGNGKLQEKAQQKTQGIVRRLNWLCGVWISVCGWFVKQLQGSLDWEEATVASKQEGWTEK